MKHIPGPEELGTYYKRLETCANMAHVESDVRCIRDHKMNVEGLIIQKLKRIFSETAHLMLTHLSQHFFSHP